MVRIIISQELTIEKVRREIEVMVEKDPRILADSIVKIREQGRKEKRFKNLNIFGIKINHNIFS